MSLFAFVRQIGRKIIGKEPEADDAPSVNVAALQSLTPGSMVTHLPTGQRGFVTDKATPTRACGWRVAVRTGTGRCYITEANIADWGLE